MRALAPLRLVSFMAMCAVIAVSPAIACLWDRDTLAMEAKGMPGIVEVITGRFFRPPPELYEVRLERVTADIKRSPDRLELYDDAAVACDRLGRSDEAIAWMEDKRRRMDLLLAASGSAGDHEYRYYANLGTFHAHRWVRAGASRDDMSDLDSARQHIARAIEINPDAHFGRERYQLLAIDWLRDPPTPQGTLPSIFDAAELDGARGPAQGSWMRRDFAAARRLDDASQGLAGLIVVGNAWESFDVFYTLAVALDSEGAASLAMLARLRCEELLAAGRGTLFPLSGAEPFLEDFGGDPGGFLGQSLGRIANSLDDLTDVTSFFRRARSEAKAWHEEKTRFMLAKLERGEHPDTHPDFWDGFVESAPPHLPGAATLFLDAPYGTFGRKAIIVGAVALLALCLVAGMTWTLRRRHPASADRQPRA